MRAMVAGAGIAGLMLALRVTRAGFDVSLVEIADGPRGEGYTSVPITSTHTSHGSIRSSTAR